MTRMTTDQAFAQGARCGHLEGKSRVGLYVWHEEFLAAEYAVEAQNLPTSILDNAWTAGYRHGYCLAAEGKELETELR